MSHEEMKEWNEKYPSGSKCLVIYDDGTEHPHVTRSVGYFLGGGIPVVLIDRKSGCYSMDRVRMV